jgi:hypothetical protein
MMADAFQRAKERHFTIMEPRAQNMICLLYCNNVIPTLEKKIQIQRQMASTQNIKKIIIIIYVSGMKTSTAKSSNRQMSQKHEKDYKLKEVSLPSFRENTDGLG